MSTEVYTTARASADLTDAQRQYLAAPVPASGESRVPGQDLADLAARGIIRHRRRNGGFLGCYELTDIGHAYRAALVAEREADTRAYDATLHARGRCTQMLVENCELCEADQASDKNTPDHAQPNGDGDSTEHVRAGMRTDDILAQIDATLGDPTVGPDAVRSTPDSRTSDGLPALLLRPDGSIETVVLPGNASGNVAALREAIGCDTVYRVRVRRDLDMWVDDIGVYTQELSDFAHLVTLILGDNRWPIYGPVVFTGGADAAGDTIGLPRVMEQAIRSIVADVTPAVTP